MKDRNGVEIEVGSLVKRYGKVLYADGLKAKLSKKTWRVSKIENDTIYYADEHGNDTILPLPKNEGAFQVISEEEFAAIPRIKPGGVPLKYRVHEDIADKGWQIGDIVQIYGNVSDDTLKSGKLERVPDETPHKHVIVVADPLKVFGNAN